MRFGMGASGRRLGLAGRIVRLALLLLLTPMLHGQQAEKSTALEPERRLLARLDGRAVSRVEFTGITAEQLGPIPGQLAQQAGVALSAEKVRASLRRL